MRRQQQLNRFGRALDDVLADRGLTNADFARLTKLAKSRLSRYKLRGPTRAPDRTQVEAWGRAAGLSAKQITALHDAIQLSFSPQYVQDLVDRLRRKDGSSQPD